MGLYGEVMNGGRGGEVCRARLRSMLKRGLGRERKMEVRKGERNNSWIRRKVRNKKEQRERKGEN